MCIYKYIIDMCVRLCVYVCVCIGVGVYEHVVRYLYSILRETRCVVIELHHLPPFKDAFHFYNCSSPSLNKSVLM